MKSKFIVWIFAIVQNALIGTSRKSVAGTTFSRRLGKNILKAKVMPYSKTPNIYQQANQNKFEGVTKIGSQISPILDLGYISLKGKRLSRPAFVQDNVEWMLGNAIGLDPINVSKFQVSKSNYNAAGFLSTTKGVNEVEVELNNSTSLPASKIPTHACVIAYLPGSKQFFFVIGVPVIEATPVIIPDADFGAGFNNATALYWSFLYNVKYASSTQYTPV